MYCKIMQERKNLLKDIFLKKLKEGKYDVVVDSLTMDDCINHIVESSYERIFGTDEHGGITVKPLTNATLGVFRRKITIQLKKLKAMKDNNIVGLGKKRPQKGDKLYLHRKTGFFYVDICKDPYTVVGINEDGYVLIQECELVFNGPRYFDTLPDDIIPNPGGEIKKLHWDPNEESWVVKWGSSDLSYAEFGSYQYQPYLD